MKPFKRAFSIFLRVGISIILLFILFRQVHYKSLWEIVRNADRQLILAAFFVFFLNYVLCVFRWQMLLKAVKIRLPFKRIIISFSGGVFFSLFLPSSIGGDLMRSIDLSVHTRRPSEVIATVFLDRLSGYIGLVILALLSLFLGFRLIQDRSTLFSVALIALLLAMILTILFNKKLFTLTSKLLHSPNAGKIRQLLKNLHQEIHYFRRQKRVIVNNLLLSILIQIISPLTFLLIAYALGLKINILYFFVFLPIIGAITLLPISIGGLGLRDASTIYFFSKAGVSQDLAFAMSLINFSFILIGGLIGGLIYVFTIRHRRVQHHPSPALHPGLQS